MIQPVISVTDSTLREGEQAAGFSPPLEAKLALARYADQLGCDLIEIGHPVIAESVFNAAKQVSDMPRRAQTLAHSLLRDDGIQTVHEVGADWIGFFFSIRPETAAIKYGLRFSDLYLRIPGCVAKAKELGLKVRFSCEDASRTELNSLLDFLTFLRGCGVDRIGYSDTAGCLYPSQAYERFQAIRDRLPEADLHFHGHNDRGLALCNALCALSCGWNSVDATILGLGERMGVVPMTELALCLDEQFGKSMNLAICSEFEAEAWRWVDVDRYAERRYSHKAGLHSMAVYHHSQCYESTPAERLGARRSMGLSKFSGAKAVLSIAHQLGMPLSIQQAKDISHELKRMDQEYWDAEEIEFFLSSFLHKRASMTPSF